MRIVLSNRHFWLFMALCGASLVVLRHGFFDAPANAASFMDAWGL